MFLSDAGSLPAAEGLSERAQPHHAHRRLAATFSACDVATHRKHFGAGPVKWAGERTCLLHLADQEKKNTLLTPITGENSMFCAVSREGVSFFESTGCKGGGR